MKQEKCELKYKKKLYFCIFQNYDKPESDKNKPDFTYILLFDGHGKSI